MKEAQLKIYEPIARRACQFRQIDPDQQVATTPDPADFPPGQCPRMTIHVPRWHVVARLVREQMPIIVAVIESMGSGLLDLAAQQPKGEA